MRFGDRLIAPGETVPAEEGRDYRGPLERGAIAFVPDQVASGTGVDLKAIGAVFDIEIVEATAQDAPADHLAWLTDLKTRVLACAAGETTPKTPAKRTRTKTPAKP